MTPPALQMPAAVVHTAVLTVASDLLGPLTVRAGEMLRFPAGIFGFPDCRRFVLVPAEQAGLYWLQSADHAPLAFLLADPFVYFDDYAVELPPADAALLDAARGSDVAVFAIVTLPRARDEAPTANLRGPLAFNLRAGVGRQLALDRAEHDLRRPIELGAAG